MLPMRETDGLKLWVVDIFMFTHISATGFWRRSLTLVLVTCFLLVVDTKVSAFVSGPCSDCHTMHYSQGGGALADWGREGVDGPFEALLTVDCVGCHTGDNSAGGKVPFVMPEIEANYGGINGTGTESGATTLAGGSFFWVSATDTCGHNVEGYCDSDATMLASSPANLPPGFISGRPAGDGSSPGNGSWGTQQITCAGTYGCHGSHATTNQARAIRGGHHALSGSEIPFPLSNSSADYRMLVGIAGIEDSDWEFQPTVNSHNQYHGVDTVGSLDSSTSTISYFCSQCHGLFHSNDDVSAPSASPWLRHPTNFDLSGASGSEYGDYNDGIGVGVYSLVAPVASDLSNPINQWDIQSEVMEAGAVDDAIITCLSCHRAHGSPHYKSLRWNYAGFANGGDCAVCHTSKK